MVLFFAVVLGITGLCVLAVYHQSPEPREKFRPRNLDRTVAEGMRLWNPKAGVDSVRFDAFAGLLPRSISSRRRSDWKNLV